MADPKIKFKRSAVPGKRPTLEQLPLGELAVNTYDGRLFTKLDTAGVGIGTTITLLTPWSENIGGGIYYNEGNVGIGTTIPYSKIHIIGNQLVTGIVTAASFDGNLNPLGNTYYVAENGSNSNTGTNINRPLSTVKYALGLSTSGDIIHVNAGIFTEVFPLTIPTGVTIRGAGLRATFIQPTEATKTNDGFLLNGETTVEDLTIGNFYEPGYGFKFAPNSKTTTRSPYVQRVTVLNRGSATSSTDPYGFDTPHNPTTSYKAGRGVLIDGSVVDPTTLEPAMLFNECTLITPNNIALEMTNGARTEWVNCFTYLADKGIYAHDGTTGIGSTGYVRIKTVGLAGSTPQANDNIYYLDANSVSGTYAQSGLGLTITRVGHGLTVGDRIYADFTSGTAVDGFYRVTGYVGINTFSITMAGSATTSGNVSYKEALGFGTVRYYDPTVGLTSISGKGEGLFELPSSRLGKTVTAYGDAQLSTSQEKFGTSSLLLDGTGDYVRCEGGTDFTFSGNFTAECWIYPTSVTGSRHLFALGTETTGRYHFSLESGVVTGNFYGSASTTFGGSISTNTWTHIALVRSGSTITSYVNGTALGTTETNSSTINNTGQLTIGADNGGINAFVGYIDEVRISNTARYTGNFSTATSQFNSDGSDKLLLHFDGVTGSVSFIDSSIPVQDIRWVRSGITTATATKITLADYQQFGAEMRSIGSATVFGNTGVTADGPGCTLRLFAFNFGHIGSGKDFSQDVSLVNQENEVITSNNGSVYFVSIDQSGDFRVGDAFYVNQREGTVNFGGQDFTLNSLSDLNVSDGTNTSTITPTSLTVGNIQISGNDVTTTSGDLNINPSGISSTRIVGDLTVTGTLNYSLVSGLDGDKGDITVSSNFTSWTIDNNVVNFNKIQNINTARILGRSTAGVGTVEELSVTGSGSVALSTGPSLSNVTISGVTTLSDSTVLIGSATSTGFASQRLQVTGNAYISGNLGIGTTNVSGNLHILSGAPTITFTDSNAASNEKNWIEAVNGKDLYWQALNDAGAGGGNLFKMSRNLEQVNTFEALNGGVSWFVIDNLNQRVGIGTTFTSFRLTVQGDGRFTGIVSALTFSGQVNSGLGTITTLNSTSGTITNLSGTIGTITTLNSTSGTITNLSGTIGTITTLNSTSGTITNLSGTIGTVTTLVATTGIITNINSSGIITASQFSTGSAGIGINTNTISGPAEIIIDPSAVGDNTGAVRIKGDLYVDGTQTYINSSVIELADFNVGIATTVGTNALLDGAGIGIGSTTIRKTITWNNTAGALTSSEDWNLVSGKQYEINGTSVLNSTTLGSGIVNSSLTSVGTLGQLSVSGLTTSSRITLNGANDTTTGGGQIYLNGATGNRIDFNTNGVAAPTFTTRSAGTKLVLYPNIGGSRADYAFGIETSTLWYSVDQTSSQHRWYAGQTQLADLKGTGELVIGSSTLTGTSSQRLQVTGDAYVSGSIGIATTNPKSTIDARGSITFGPSGINTISECTDIDSWEYSGKFKSVTTDDATAQAIYIGAAGTAMFVVGNTNDRVLQYTLSVAYDVSTAGAAITFFPTTQETTPTGIDFNSNGTKMFIVGQAAASPLILNGEYVHEYSLSTPWNVAPTSVGYTTSYNVTQETSPQGVVFGNNGSKMYVIGSTNDAIFQYSLSTPYSLASGVTYDNVSLSISSTASETIPTDLSFNSSGTVLWVIGQTNNRIYEFRLSSAWNISTAVFYDDFYIGFNETAPTGLQVIDSQNLAYIIGTAADSVYQYNINSPSVKVNSRDFSSIVLQNETRVKENLYVRKETHLDGNFVAQGALTVSGSGTFGGNLTVSGGTITAGNVAATLLGNTSTNITFAGSQTSGALTIGGALQTGGTVIGRSTVSHTISIASGVSLASTVKTVNLATGGGSGSLTLLTLGSATAGAISTVFVPSPSSLIIGGTGASTGTSSQLLQVTGGAYVSGNVGVGTTNPGEKLQVDGNLRVGISTNSNYIAFYGTLQDNAGVYNHTYIGERIWEATEKSELFLFKGNDADASGGPDRIRLAAGQIRLDTYPSGTFVNGTFEGVATNSNVVNRVVVHSTGEVGIGTDVLTGTSSQLLQVNSGAYISGNLGIGITTTSNKLDVLGPEGSFVIAARTSGSNGLVALIPDGTNGNGLRFGGNGANANILRFIGLSDIEKVRIDANGNLGIATTNPTSKLYVVGDSFITGVTTSTDFDSLSDIRLKTNIKTISNPLDKVMQIRGVTFNWKKDDRNSAGVIAQEIEKVFPDLVHGDDKKTVNYNGIIGLLVECIKEQQEQINQLKNKP